MYPSIKRSIEVIGGGPAGSSAAIAAALEGSSVRIFEKSHFPRHKVCGEFLSPEIAPLLEHLGCWARFAACQPSRIHSVRLHLGGRVKRWTLREPAFGLSRYCFDQLLLEHARTTGAEVVRGRAEPSGLPAVVAHGRHFRAEKPRLFAFKAHFSGPVDDVLDLIFSGDTYAGICAIEGGRTNVCGVAPEHRLAECGFAVDEFLGAEPVFAARLEPLRREMDWLITGPLLFRGELSGPPAPGIYPAGDALGFVDPFTGTGMLSAVWSGMLAGRCAAAGVPVSRYLGICRSGLVTQYRAAAAFRRAAAWSGAGFLARLVPGNLLYRLTRPRIA
jgi:hypothetical protein